MLHPLRVLPAFALWLLLFACSDAETPQAYFDAGTPGPGPTSDAGPSTGGRDKPCENGRCDINDLVCVSEGQAKYCRLRCNPNDPNDPCGPDSTCGRLTDGSGACLPAGGLDGPCPCDEGFACTRLEGQDGGPNQTLCKKVCDPNADAGTQCTPPETCRPLSGSNIGVCIE